MSLKSLLTLFLLCFNSVAYTTDQKAQDYFLTSGEGQLLRALEINYLNQRLKQLHKKTDLQVQIILSNSLDPQQFAKATNQQEINRPYLSIGIDMENRKILSSGNDHFYQKGAEQIVDALLQLHLDYFKRHHYLTGLTHFISQLERSFTAPLATNSTATLFIRLELFWQQFVSQVEMTLTNKLFKISRNIVEVIIISLMMLIGGMFTFYFFKKASNPLSSKFFISQRIIKLNKSPFYQKNKNSPKLQTKFW